jgi:dihydroneopterin aldolase / 2-amino-4-hydroxy-6-hydroxymethyldihydropteridine diphosphokinase
VSTQDERSGTPLDRIRLTGIAATGYHGVFEHERREGQPFVADVVVYLDTRRAAARDDLAHTLDYGALAQEVAAVLAGEPVDLIETVAERIAATVLAHAVVQGVDVAVHKPQAPIPVPFGDVVIEIHRDRAKLPAAEPYHPEAAHAERGPRPAPTRTAALPVVGAGVVPEVAAAAEVPAFPQPPVPAAEPSEPDAAPADVPPAAPDAADEPWADEPWVDEPWADERRAGELPAGERPAGDFPFDEPPAPIETPVWAPIPGVSGSVDTPGEPVVVAPAPIDALPPGVQPSPSHAATAAAPAPGVVGAQSAPVMPLPPIVPPPIVAPPIPVPATVVPPIPVPPVVAPPIPVPVPPVPAAPAFAAAEAAAPPPFVPPAPPTAEHRTADDDPAPTAPLPATSATVPGAAETAPQPIAAHAEVPAAVTNALALTDVVDGEIVLDVLDEAPPAPVDVVLALGANLGLAQETLRRAVHDLAATPGLEIVRVSPLARTAPVGGPEQPDFLNAVLLARTTLAPRELLHATQAVEQRHGRERHEHWGPRTLDVDIVVYGHVLAVTDDLELPHPRAHERAFVLQPWAEVDPQAVLPGLGGGPVAALAATAPDREGLRWLALDWLNGTPPAEHQGH